MSTAPVVIVGAGHAGVQLAASLREEGYSGPVALLSADPHLPYQRPPLSKAFLKGQMEADGLPLRAAQFYRDKEIDLLLGETATGVDRHARRVELASGRRLDYGHLVLATGARQRPLEAPGVDLAGVMALRDLADARGLRERVNAARHIVVIGAGFIGLEVAATAAALGGEVTVVELGARPLGRAVSPATSAFFLEAHQAFGARVLLGVGVAALYGRDGALDAVELTDGSVLPADLAVIGIGVLPEDRLARQAGVACANGIVVDEFLATADPLVSAIGDCAAFPNPLTGAPVRLEIGAERRRSGPLPRPPAGRQTRTLRRVAVVLERPGRPQAADRRAFRRRRSLGAARRSAKPGICDVRLSRRRAGGGRDGQPSRRSYGGAANHRRRPAAFGGTGGRSEFRPAQVRDGAAPLSRLAAKATRVSRRPRPRSPRPMNPTRRRRRTGTARRRRRSASTRRRIRSRDGAPA